MVGRYFALFGSDYYKIFHSFVLLGELAKLEFGKLCSGQGKVHFDRNTSAKAFKDKEKVKPFSTPQFPC